MTRDGHEPIAVRHVELTRPLTAIEDVVRYSCTRVFVTSEHELIGSVETAGVKLGQLGDSIGGPAILLALVGKLTAFVCHGILLVLTPLDWVMIDAAFAENDDPLAAAREEKDFEKLFSRIVNLAPPPIGVGPAPQ